MRIVLGLVLLAFSATCFAQKIQLAGHVIDAQTGTAIGQVNLSIPEKGLFYPSDRDGGFVVLDKAISQSDSVNFSCIGYQTQKLKAGDISTNVAVKLTPLVKVLKEVKIGLVELGSKRKQEEMWTAYSPLHEEAMYMPNSHGLAGTVQSVGFFLANALDGDVSAPFRIRIYEASADTMPAKELTQDIVIAVAHKSNAWFDVDLSAYDIAVPKNGFFVAFCLFDGTHYVTSTQPGIGSNVVTPRLGMTQFEFNKHLSYHWQNRHKIWYWEREPFTNNYMIRAAVVPE